MKRNCIAGVIIALALFSASAEEVLINPAKNSTNPSSFTPDKKAVCVKNSEGAYVIRIDAEEVPVRIYRTVRIPVKQGDTMTLKLNITGAGALSYGFYLYDGKNKYLVALYKARESIAPDKKDYVFTGVVPKNPQEKSAFDRPAFAFLFIQALKGAKLDVSKFEYERKGAPEKTYELPEI